MEQQAEASRPEVHDWWRDDPLLEKLNARQVEAVTAGDGPTLVLAGPGSGKTTVICSRIAYLIEVRRVKPRNIAAITFTRKAADEMKERVHGMLGPLYGKNVHVSTFHSMCGRILREDGHRVGIDSDYRIASTQDKYKLLYESLGEVRGGAGGIKAQGVLQHISTIKNDLQNTDEPNQWAKTEFGESMAQVAGVYQEKLLDQNMLDFDDMMLWSIRLLHEHEDVREKYQDQFEHLLVDEYQDTNLPQYVLIRQLANDRNNVFVVGDPDQAIYEWRGASIENIMQFEDDFAGARRIDLNTTYRSTKNILEAANALIQPNKARIDREIDTTQDRGQPVQLLLTPSPSTEADYAAKTARARIDADGGSVAVLYRTNAQGRAMEAAFKDEQLPYKVAGGESFYESKEVLDCLACVSVALDPRGDDEATKRFVTMVPGERISKIALRQIDQGGQRGNSFYDKLKFAAENGSLTERDERIANKRLQTIEKLEEAGDDTPAQIIQQGLGATGYRDALERSDDKRRLDKLDNIEELIADAQQFALDHRSQAVDGEPRNDQIAHGFVRQCEEIRAAAHEQEQNGQCVTLSTLHAAKGLEFDTVIFAGFDSERMPHRRSVTETDNPAAAVEEERRLAYVGMTRARDELHLTVPLTIGHGRKQKRVARSEFINDIPDHLVEQRLPSKPHPRPAAAGDTERSHDREHGHEYAAAAR